MNSIFIIVDCFYPLFVFLRSDHSIGAGMASGAMIALGLYLFDKWLESGNKDK